MRSRPLKARNTLRQTGLGFIEDQAVAKQCVECGAVGVFAFEQGLREFVKRPWDLWRFKRGFLEWVMLVELDLRVAEVTRLEMPPHLLAAFTRELSFLKGDEFE